MPFEQKTNFKVSFSKDCQEAPVQTVPDALLCLIRIILEGPNIKHCTSGEVLSQLIISNSTKGINLLIVM